MARPKASDALARFTVLDLTQVRSDPAAVRQLADWGANVRSAAFVHRQRAAMQSALN